MIKRSTDYIHTPFKIIVYTNGFYYILRNYLLKVNRIEALISILKLTN